MREDFPWQPFNVGFWNTGLSPNKDADRADDQALIDAGLIIKELIESERIDLLGLTEVSDLVLDQIRDVLPENFVFLHSMTNLRYSKFNMSFVVNTACLDLEGGIIDILEGLEDAQEKVAKRLVLRHKAGHEFYVFASHWPSPMGLMGEHGKVAGLAKLLRSNVDNILLSDKDSPIILMGDYNEEPFTEAMWKSLRVARSTERVLGKKSLLYNPFWENLSHFDMSHTHYRHGTQYYKSGLRDQWASTDQIIVSSGVVGGDNMRLKDGRAKVHTSERVLSVVLDDKSKFNHLPVFLQIEVR